MKILKFCKFCKKEIFEGDYCSELCANKYGINVVNSQIAEDTRLYRDGISARLAEIDKEQISLICEKNHLIRTIDNLSSILNRSNSL